MSEHCDPLSGSHFDEVAHEDIGLVLAYSPIRDFAGGAAQPHIPAGLTSSLRALLRALTASDVFDAIRQRHCCRHCSALGLESRRILPHFLSGLKAEVTARGV